MYYITSLHVLYYTITLYYIVTVVILITLMNVSNLSPSPLNPKMFLGAHTENPRKGTPHGVRAGTFLGGRESADLPLSWV